MKVVDMSFFSDFIDGRRQTLAQDNMGTSLGQHAQRHAPCCVQHACSSTHKASLSMVLSWIFQWWRLDISFGMRLDDTGLGRWPLASMVAGNPKNQFIFLDLLHIGHL
jgi:hypothetical protein